MIKKVCKYFMLLLFLALCFGLSPRPAIATDIKAVAENLTGITGEDVNIRIIDSKKPEAYLHPMGYIVITTGLIKIFKNDSEIAFIIGHELAHIAMEHYKGETDILGIISKNSDTSNKIYKEIEADAGSFSYMKAAGYEPAASISVLKRMIDIGIGGHNPMQKRIDALTHFLLLMEYQ